MTKYIYYPGCSMESSAKAYAASLKTICEPLGLELQEINDWNCCGATEYVSISLTPAYSLITRNLALAEMQSKDTNTLIAPCSACYLNLAKADHFMQERPSLGVKVNEALKAGGLHYTPGSLKIRHLLDIIVNEIGLASVKEAVERPLTGLRVAPYLGCMVPRPDYEHRWSDYEFPTELDRLLKALGAEVVDYPLKTECCGGHMTQIGPETAFELIRRLVDAADSRKADVMVTVCPMCQMNLDAYQGETNRFFKTNYNMPVLFFTQLIGLAFGRTPEEVGIGSELVSARTAIGKIGLQVPAPEGAEPPKPKPRKTTGLPMPQMPVNESGNQTEVN